MGLYAATSNKAGASGLMWQLWAPTADLDVISVILSTTGTAPTNAPDFDVVRTTTRGTQNTTVTPVPYDSNDNAGTGVIDSAWTIGPGGVGTVSLVRRAFPAESGVSYLELLEQYDCIKVRTGAGLAVRNLSTIGAQAGTYTLWIRWRE